MNYKIIHITGASGSGTTTLAKAIHDKYDYEHFDTDDFFWEQTDPPFKIRRPSKEREDLLMEAIDSADKCVVSGSLSKWGDIFIPKFDLVIYMYTPTEIRIQRLHERQLMNFGNRILPGGDMFEEHEDFLKWAAEYDDGGLDMRSASHHAKWLEKIPCSIIKADGTLSPEKNINLLKI